MDTWWGKRNWILLKQHPIFQRGIQHTSKAASAVSLLDLGLMDSTGPWTHAGKEMYTHTPTHQDTQAHTQAETYKIQQLRLIRFTTTASNAPRSGESCWWRWSSNLVWHKISMNVSSALSMLHYLFVWTNVQFVKLTDHTHTQTSTCTHAPVNTQP